MNSTRDERLRRRALIDSPGRRLNLREAFRRRRANKGDDGNAQRTEDGEFCDYEILYGIRGISLTHAITAMKLALASAETTGRLH